MPRYMVRKEFQREKLRRRARITALEYKKRLGERGELVKLCWEDLRRRTKK